jgi:hypothetical protein
VTYSPPCAAISPISHRHGSGAETGTFIVTAPPTCNWTAVGNRVGSRSQTGRAEPDPAPLPTPWQPTPFRHTSARQPSGAGRFSPDSRHLP